MDDDKHRMGLQFNLIGLCLRIKYLTHSGDFDYYQDAINFGLLREASFSQQLINSLENLRMVEIYLRNSLY